MYSGHCRAVSCHATALQPAVNDGEKCRDKKQGGHGGQQQAADDGAAQRGVLLAAVAQAHRHGYHADNHGQCGH